MTAFVDLDSIHVPSSGQVAPASWGLQVNANFDHFNELELATVTSGTRPGSPVTNKLIRETDTNDLLVWNGSAWQIISHVGAMKTYTPTLVQPTAVTKTVTYAKYQKVGRKVSGYVHLAVTGSGTGANTIVVGLPLTAVSIGVAGVIGVGSFFDASAGLMYTAPLFQISTTTAELWRDSAGSPVGGSPNPALASSDQISYMFEYEAASD